MKLEDFKNALIAKRDELRQLNSDSKSAAETVALDQSKVGRLSRMDAMQAQQMAQETVRRRQFQLQRIDSALRRIDADDYGYCYKCGELIEEERLKFDPASTRCINCVED